MRRDLQRLYPSFSSFTQAPASDFGRENEWFRPLSLPQKLSAVLPIAVVAATTFFYCPSAVVPLEDRNEAPWHQPLSEPVRWKGLRPDSQQFLAYGPRYDYDPAQLIAWHRPLSEPVRWKGLRPHSQQAFIDGLVPRTPVTITIALKKTPVNLTFEKVTLYQTTAYSPFVEVGYDPSTNLGWFQPIEQPTLTVGLKAHQQQFEPQRAFDTPTAVTVTAAAQSPAVNVVFEKIVLYQSITYGPRYDFDTRSQIGWYSPLDEPTRRKGIRPHQQQANIQGNLEPIVVTDFYEGGHPPSPHVVFKQSIIYPSIAYGPRYDFNARSQIGWYQPLSEPRIKRKDMLPNQQQAFAYGPRYEFDAATQIGWHRPFDDFARARKRLDTGSQQYLAFEPFPRPFTIEWAPALSTPSVLAKRGLRATDQVANFFTYFVQFAGEGTEYNWFSATEEPVRTKLGLLSQFQQDFIHTPIPIAAPVVVPPEEEVVLPTAVPDRGFDETLEAFQRQLDIERRQRDERDLERIVAIEDEFILSILRKLI